jgi:excinuclease ABC subunit C
MEAAKTKTLTHSTLTRIPGIGDKKAKLLLKALGSVAAVREATVEELAAVRGISRTDAEHIRTYYDQDTQNRKES